MEMNNYRKEQTMQAYGWIIIIIQSCSDIPHDNTFRLFLYNY